jgi:hypothetical protein
MPDTRCGLGRIQPTGTVTLALPSGQTVDVPLAITTYESWGGDPIADTYGGKPVVVDSRGKPAFAELAILRDLEAAGWQGVWVDSYRNRILTDWPPVRGEIDRVAARRFDRISQSGTGKSWDVFAWCGERILFVESKRAGKDAIRRSQLAWLEAALRAGLSATDFLLVEWSLA